VVRLACLALVAVAVALAAACGEYTAFDTSDHLQRQLAAEIGAPVEVPFALDEEVEAFVDDLLRPSPSEEYRVEQVLDLIFRKVGLTYALYPTRNASETFRARQGNCLSFVNLFVGTARRLRLNPFYVEVNDYQRWNYRQGMVVSQGHIVAGLYIGGGLRTFDFLPYAEKGYKSFAPIDDRTATAHYYNNLAAERLLAGDAAAALPLLDTAAAVAPGFLKAQNNLAVALTRLGRAGEALEVLAAALEEEPRDGALLTNQVRALLMLGRRQEALATLDLLEETRTLNPFFYVYRADMALAAGDPRKALEYLREAMRRDTEIPEVHLGLVKAYLALGDVGKARHHLSRALRLDATHEEALRLARMLHEG
ncbi:MAG TPA: tetratricopeptide repeat protein, partial [Thermoanaerobaculia bacterium]|nr:tetratricopeptide repeat protein [Thermoanaerobaculia bacterium]